MRLCYAALLVILYTLTTELNAQDTQPKAVSQWQATSQMPLVCVAQFNAKSDPKTLSLLLPIPEYKIKDFAYDVDVPIKNDDGTTSIKKETRTRQGQVLVYDMVRHEIPLTDIEILTLDEKKLSPQAVLAQLAKPKHLLYGEIPDMYSRAVLKDDLLILRAANGTRLPTVAPKQKQR